LTVLKRTMDATFLNKVANTEGVREWLGGEGALDLTPLIANPENVTFQDDCGGFIAEKLGAGLYECHSLFLPEGRGFGVYEAMRQGLHYMFVETDCMEVVTKVPLDNRAARGLALKASFVKAFDRDNAWRGADGNQTGVHYMTLSYWAWLRSDDMVERVGRTFHETLERLAKAPNHPDDPAHNRAAGACALMCMAGNAAKGVFLYNRWARLAGYLPIGLLQQNPAIINIDGTVVSVRNRDMEVLRCQ
jgi:hypothetical protein